MTLPIICSGSSLERGDLHGQTDPRKHVRLLTILHMDLLILAEANGRNPKSQALYLHGFVFLVKNGKCKGKLQINFKKISLV